MYFYPANFRLPFLAGAYLAVALSVEAQQPATNAGQSIIFSSPDNGVVSSNLALFPTKSSPLSNSRDGFQNASPISTFDNPSDAPLPAPSEGQQLPRLLERRNDWIFMTPAEILGVTTPEKILKVQERDAAGRPKNLTPIERYNERQQAKNSGTNDSHYSRNSTPFGDFSGDRNNRTNAVSFNPTDSGLKNLRPTIFNRSLNAAPNNNPFANPNDELGWSKLVGLPAQSPAPNPAQQADMEQFKRLLEPGFSPAAPTMLSPGGTTFQPQTLSSSGSIQPLGNPVGASFTPLNSGIGKPSGLESLPGVTGQAATPSAMTPSWAPQPPPWMSQTPQPFVIPQRKF